MRRLLLTLTILLMVLSCAKEQEYESNGFVFDHKVYEVSNKGGTITINYTMLRQFGEPRVMSNGSWLTIESITPSSVTLRAKKNLSRQRETEVVFTNPRSYVKAEVIVRQEAYKGKSLIEVSVSDITTRSCNAKATAKLDDMLIVTFMSSSEYFEEDLDDWEDMAADIVRLRYHSAMEQGISLVEYLEQNNLGGYHSVERHYDDLLPGYMMHYCAFGISFDENSNYFEIITPLYYKSFDCKTPDKRDITLSCDIEVEGADLELTIDPGEWDGYYAYNIVSKSRSSSYFPPSTVVDDELHRQWAKYWYTEYHLRVIDEGMPAEEFIALYCSKGLKTTHHTLYALEDYVLVAYAIDIVEGVPQVVSPLYFQHFQTEEVGRADLTVDVVFKEIYGRMVRFDIIPSNDEDSYVAGIIKRDIIDTTADSVIIGALTENIDPVNGVKYGKYSGEALLLQPETEYVLCVVGSHGNMITTDLMCFEFTTGVAEPCAVEVENVTFGGPYSIRELYEYDSWYLHSSYLDLPYFIYCLMWYEIETSGEPYKIYSYIFDTADIEEDPYLAEVELMRTPTNESEAYIVHYDTEMVIWCCVMDDKGNLSEIYRTAPFTLNIGDDRDPSEIAEVLDRIWGGTRSTETLFNEFKGETLSGEAGAPTIEIIPISPIR